MNTLSGDLSNLLSKHFDVLPTVFLTDRQLELEDNDNASVYQENWPWILYILKSPISRYSDNIVEWIVKNDYVDILNFVQLDGVGVSNLYLFAHKYYRLDLINKYVDQIDTHTRNYHAKLYAAAGGHSELLFSILIE